MKCVTFSLFIFNGLLFIYNLCLFGQIGMMSVF